MVLINRAKELEAQGRTIANMVVGEPDAPTPPLIAAAGIRAIEDGRIGYTSSLGITELRDSIAAWYHTRYGSGGAALASGGDGRFLGRIVADHGRVVVSG